MEVSTNKIFMHIIDIGQCKLTYIIFELLISFKNWRYFESSFSNVQICEAVFLDTELLPPVGNGELFLGYLFLFPISTIIENGLHFIYCVNGKLTVIKLSLPVSSPIPLQGLGPNKCSQVGTNMCCSLIWSAVFFFYLMNLFIFHYNII